MSFGKGKFSGLHDDQLGQKVANVRVLNTSFVKNTFQRCDILNLKMLLMNLLECVSLTLYH